MKSVYRLSWLTQFTRVNPQFTLVNPLDKNICSVYPYAMTTPSGDISVPAALICAPGLPAAALHTWMQLRLLAQGGQAIAAGSMRELSRLTGKSPSTLYNHLAMLKNCGALRWRSAGQGVLSITFSSPEAPAGGEPTNAGAFDYAPKPAGQEAEISANAFQNSRIPETGIAPSLNPHSAHLIKTTDSFKGEEGEFQDSRKPESGAGEAGKDPLAVYRAQTGRRPNPAQRLEMQRRVSDLERWRATLAHWQMHGWNPGNLAGLLELYERGGPVACRFCSAPSPGAARPAAGPSTVELLDEMLAEVQQERAHDAARARQRSDHRHA